MKNNLRVKYTVLWSLFVVLVSINTSVNAQNKKRTKTNIKQDSTALKSVLINKLSSEQIDMGNNTVSKKQLITSAIDKVSGAELEKTNSFNPANSLYGLLPGLTVLQNPGPTGSRGPSMNIRGINTLNNNSILVLVDGVESDISDISTLEIESVEVLKDAGALAIYGQRGANGVLLVTTKMGVPQKMEVNVKYQNGLIQAVKFPDFLDAAGYAQAINQARSNDGLSPLYSQTAIQKYSDGSSPSLYPNVNWLDESLRDMGTTMNLNTTFRGGNSKLIYFASINYQAENGLYKDRNLEPYASQDKYDRINFRTNLKIDLTPKTVFTTRVYGNIEELYTPASSFGSIFNAIYRTPANAFPVLNYNNNWGGTNIYGNNPVAMINATGYLKNQGTNIGINATLKQDLGTIINGLSGELNVRHANSATSTDGQSKSYLYEQLTINENTSAVSSQLYGQNSDLVANSGYGPGSRFTNFMGKLNYDTKIDNNTINAFALFSQDKSVGRGQYTTFIRQNFAGKVHYGYKDKYLADVTLSYAGSSVLPKDRFEFYPAISGAWVVSEEDFMKGNSIVNYFKLRGSFGYAGNDRITQNTEDQSYGGVGNYYFTQNNTSFGSTAEGRLGGNPMMEKAMMSNLGLDINFFKRLNFSVDAFYNKRSNILVTADGQTSNVIGVNAPYSPVGEVSNRGLEASLTWQNKVSNFNYSATAMFSYAKNKIEEMAETPQAYSYLNRTGQSIGQAFGLVSNGFFATQAEIDSSNPQSFSVLSPGDIKYLDQNGDNIIDNFDEVALGYSTRAPEMYFSLNLHADYKGFGTNAIFQGVAHQTVLMNTPSVFWPLINNGSITTFSNNAWTPSTAQTASLPRLTTLDNSNNYRSNDIWLASGDYIKLRTLEFYYSLPETFLSKCHIDDFKITLRGTNLFTWDKIEQLDAEAVSTSYPLLKSYSLGLELTF